MLKEILEWLPLVVAAAAVIYGAAIYIQNFRKLPKDQQIAAIKEWLVYATTEAEKKLGSGTGKLKLLYVYDLFVNTFEYAGKYTFDEFSEFVDEALVNTNRLITTNSKVAEYVNEQPASETVVVNNVSEPTEAAEAADTQA